MRQMLYKSKETMNTENIIVPDRMPLEQARKEGWKTVDEILGLVPEAVTETVNESKAVDIDTQESGTASVGIDIDGDDKVDMRVSIPSKRGRPSKNKGKK